MHAVCHSLLPDHHASGTATLDREVSSQIRKQLDTSQYEVEALHQEGHMGLANIRCDIEKRGIISEARASSCMGCRGRL